MSYRIAQTLAGAFVSGPWQFDLIVGRGEQVLGKRWRWLRPLCRRLLSGLGDSQRPRRAAVAQFILADRGFLRACEKYDEIEIFVTNIPPAEMSPAEGAPSSWTVPPIVTEGQIARWLDLSASELDWFADTRYLESKLTHGPLRHYRYRWLPKRVSGSARLIESPKWRLKAIQRKVLQDILSCIPAHDAAHGFRRGRSIKSFVEPHIGKQVVVRMDLRDFFPSVPIPRIPTLFRIAGYPDDVASTFSALCTNVAPSDVWKNFPVYGSIRDQWRHESLYAKPHLPQGAPTSPALANLCSYRLDSRLSGLARSMSAHYTRYADDLLFSADKNFSRSIRPFQVQVCAIAKEEGFQVNVRKTRIMRQGSRQHAAGIVVNQHANICRTEYDRLKAILHNCSRYGPETQNRSGHPEFRKHLAGRIAHVHLINPARGERLASLFDGIDWQE